MMELSKSTKKLIILFLIDSIGNTIKIVNIIRYVYKYMKNHSVTVELIYSTP